MSSPASTVPVARANWRVRVARSEDAPAAANAVRELLCELGGSPPPASAMHEAARALIADADAGALLVADADDQLVGVLGASWQTAIHTAGRYALIQDLWVHPAWRGKAVGSDLLAALFELARTRTLARVEVGLPSARYARLAATEAFYRANGFELLGVRMRRSLA